MREQGAANTPPEAVTVDRIEHAVHIVAEMMVKHDVDLMPTIRQLESERDKLRQKTAHMDYARKILQSGRNKGSNTTEAMIELSI